MKTQSTMKQSTPIQSTPIQTTRSRISSTVQSIPPSGIRRFFDLVANTKNIISLGVGEPDYETPWRISEAGIHSLESGHTSYTSNSGMPVLRHEIAKYVHTHHKAEYQPESEIIVTVGGSEALDITMRALLEPGDEVIIIDPSFVSYAPLVTLAGGVPVRIHSQAENGFTPTLDQLEDAVSSKTKAILLNYPNNPTGATLPPDVAGQIVSFVKRHDLFIISDEIYLPLTYEGDPVSFAAYKELHDQLILIHGFSKAWAMTGWRLGFAAGPADIIAAMTKIHQYTIMSAPTTAQHAAVEALRHGMDDVEVMRREYNRRRRYFSYHLTKAGLPCFAPRGAFYVFPSIQSTGLSSEEFAMQLLDQERVAVVPGTAFGECGEGFVRCSYASSMEQLREAAMRMENFANRCRYEAS